MIEPFKLRHIQSEIIVKVCIFSSRRTKTTGNKVSQPLQMPGVKSFCVHSMQSTTLNGMKRDRTKRNLATHADKRKSHKKCEFILFLQLCAVSFLSLQKMMLLHRFFQQFGFAGTSSLLFCSLFLHVPSVQSEPTSSQIIRKKRNYKSQNTTLNMRYYLNFALV